MPKLTVVWFAGLTLLLSACAQPSHYRPINEQAMYGGQPKPQELVESDRRFVEGMRQEGTPRQNVDRLLAQSYAYAKAGDLAAAMRRANQAWLLLPDDGKVHHAFAAIMQLRGDAPFEIDPFWARAAQTLGGHPSFLRDWSRYNCRRGRTDPCLELMQLAYRADPNSPNRNVDFAEVHYYRREFAEAWRYVIMAERGGEALPSGFVNALSGRMARPQ
jgi:tetratricopeptide (TPR) repeat protein